MSGFQKATRATVKARVALTGPSGSGKTMTALALATGLAEGGRVACIDTEQGSASMYGEMFDFDVLELGPPFAPHRYMQAVNEAVRAGYAAVVIDSTSHAWSGEGGVLSIVDRAAERAKGNSYAGWREGTPAQNELVDVIVRAPVHMVCTVRVKQDYVLETVNGKQVPKKVGLKPIQRDEFDYEFTIVAEMNPEHRLTVIKARAMPELQDLVVNHPNVDFGRKILAELRASGADSGETSSAPLTEAAGHRGGGALPGGQPAPEPSSDVGPSASGDAEVGEEPGPIAPAAPPPGTNGEGGDPAGHSTLQEVIDIYGTRTRVVFEAHRQYPDIVNRPADLDVLTGAQLDHLLAVRQQT